MRTSLPPLFFRHSRGYNRRLKRVQSPIKEGTISSVLIAVAFLFIWASVDGQEAKINPGAEKYYEALQKTPSRGYLFGRFFNSWLETDSVENLEKFLTGKAEASRDNNDRILLALFFSRQGQIDRAIEVFSRAIEADPLLSDIREQRARLLARKLEFKKAVADLDAALRIEGQKADDIARITKVKGRYLLRDGNFDAALAVWKNLLTKSPDDTDLHEDVIELLANEGHFEEAAKQSELLIAKTRDPYQKAIRSLRKADLLVFAEKDKEAVKVYQENLLLTGNGSWLEREIIAKVAALFRREDDLEGLEKWLDQMTKQNPRRVGIRQARSYVLAEIGKHDEAIEAYRAILEMSPGDRTVKEEFIFLLRETGKLDEAVKQQRTLITLFPNDPELDLNLSILLDENRQREEAGVAVESYLEKSGQTEFDFIRAARHLEKFGQRDKGRTTFEKAISLYPQSAELKENFAAYLYRIEEKTEAFSLYKKLAETAERDQLIRIGGALSSFMESETAYEILHSRKADFDNDYIFLGALIQSSALLKNDPTELVLKRVGLAESVEELDLALKQGTAVLGNDAQRKKAIKFLAEKQNRTPNESCLLARLYERDSRLNRAVSLLETSAESADRSEAPIYLSQLAILYRRDRNYTKEGEILQKITNLPGGKTSRNTQAMVISAINGGRSEEGLQWIDEWKRLSPGASLPWIKEAELLQQSGRIDDAISRMRRAAGIFKDDTEVQVKLAKLHDSAGNPTEAMRVFWNLYEEAEEIGTRLLRVANLHEIASKNGEIDELLADFEERERKNRTSLEPILARAEIYRREKNWQGRRDALAKASRMAPDDFSLINGIADAELMLGNWEAAMSILSGVKTNDKSGKTLQRMARIEIKHGDPEKGYQMLTEVASKNPNQVDPKIVEEIADLMIGNYDHEIVVPYLDKYISVFPKNYRLKYLRAIGLEENGDTDKAIDAFLALLSVEEEMQDKAIDLFPKSSPYHRARKVREKNGTDLPEVCEFWTYLQSAKSNAYGYLQSSNSRRPSGSQLDRVVFPPLDLEALKLLAYSHLSRIHDDLDEAGQSILLKKLSETGMPHPEISLEIASGQTDYRRSPIDDDLIARFPENINLLTYWLYWYQTNYGTAQPKESQVISAIDTFQKAGNQQLGIVAGLTANCFSDSPEAVSAFEKAIADLEKVENPGPVLAYAAIRATGNRLGSDAISRVSLENRQKLLGILQGWHEQGKDLGNAGNYSYTAVFKNFASNGRWEELFAFIEADRKAAPNDDHSFYWYEDLRSFAPLAFKQLEGYPQRLRLRLVKNQSRSANSIVWDRVQIEKAIDTVESAPLKIAFLHLASAGEKLKPLIENLEKKEDRTVNESLALASYAEDKDRPADFIKHALDARENTAEQRLKKFIDGAIVYAAMQAGEASEELWAEGRKAILRLKNAHAAVDDESIYRLIAGGLTKLGYPGESRKLLASNQQTRSGIRSIVGRSSRASIKSKLEEYLKNDQKEKAASLVRKEIRRIARDASVNMHGSWQNNYYNIYYVMREKNLAKKAVEEFEKTVGASTKKLFEAAIVNELFESRSAALPWYEKVLARDPDHLRARSRVSGLYAEKGEIEKAAKVLTGAEDADFTRLMQFFRNEDDGLGQNRPPREITIQIAEVVVRVLEAKRNAEMTDYSWALSFLEELERKNDWGSVEIGHVHNLKPLFDDRFDSESSRKQSEELEKKRDGVRTKFFKVGAEIPELASALFASEVASLIQEGADPEDFVDRAKRIVENQPGGVTERRHGGSLDYSGVYQPVYHPREFLIRNSWKKFEVTDIPKWVDSSSNTTWKERNEKFANLYLCEPEKFSKAAEDFRIKAGDRNAMFHVVWAWNDRKLDPAFFEGILKSELKRSNGRVVWLMNYLYLLTQHKEFGGEEAKAFDYLFEIVAEEVMGPKEKRNQLVKDATPKSNTRINYSSKPGKYIFQTVVPIAKHEEYFFPAVKNLKGYGFRIKDLLDYIYRYRNYDYPRSKENLDKLFAEAPWFGEIKDFEFVESSDFGYNTGSLFGFLLNRAKSETTVSKTVAEAVKQAPDSFGKSILSLFASRPNDLPGQLLALIDQHIDEFKALPEEEAQKWIKLFEANKVTIAKVGEGTEHYESFKWLHDQGMKTREDQITKFLSATKASDTGLSDRDLESEMRTLITQFIPVDRAKAKQVFLHGWNLVRKDQQRGGWSGSTSYNGWTWGPNFLDDYLDAKHGGIEETGFWLDIMRSDKDGRFPHTGWIHDGSHSSRMRAVIDREGGAFRSGDSVPKMLTALHKELGDGPISILALPFYDLVAKYPKPQRANLIKAADRVAGAGKPESALARELAMAGRFFFQSRPEEVPKVQITSIENIDQWKRHALQSLREEDLSGSWRVPLANHYCDRGIKLVDDETAMCVGEIVAKALEDEADFNGWNLLHTLRAFNRRQGLDGWDEIAARIKSGWRKKNSKNDRPRNTDEAFDPLTPVVLAVLELALRTGDHGAWNQFVSQNGDVINSQPDTLFLLIEYGAWEQARTMLKKNATELDRTKFGTLDRTYLARFTRKRRDQLDAFLPTVEDADLRIFCRALLESAPDLTPENRKDFGPEWVGRGKRLSETAKKFRETTFSDEKLRSRTLEQLIAEVQVINILKDELREAFEAINVAQIPHSNDYDRIAREMRIPAAYAWSELRQGRADVLKKIYTDIRNSPGAREYYKNEGFEALVFPIWNRVRWNGHRMKPEQLEHVIEGCQIFLEDYSVEDRHFTDHDDLACAWVIAGILANKSDQVQQWLTDLPEEQRKRVLVSMSGHSSTVFNFLTGATKCRTPHKLPGELRLRMAIEYFSNPMIRGGLTPIQRNQLFQQLIKQKVLSEEEIWEAREKLEKAWPRGGFAADELAGLGRDRGDLAAALQWADKALSRLPNTKKPPANRGMFLLTKAEILMATGDRKGAGETLQEFELHKTIYKRHASRADLLRKSINAK